MNRAARFDALVTAMKTGVTFGGLSVGAVFHFPARPETLLVKTSPRRYAYEGAPGGAWPNVRRFTTGAKTAVVEVAS